MSAANVEDIALAVLRGLLATAGQPLVMSILADVLGGGTTFVLNEVSALIADVLKAAISATSEDRVRELVSAQYDAADAVATSDFLARFGK